MRSNLMSDFMGLAPGCQRVSFMLCPDFPASVATLPMRSNLMSEFMGLVRGQYDAKADGFLPGALPMLSCAVVYRATLLFSQG